MAIHYGTTVIPARVRKPQDKAKVEVGVLIVERWILARLRRRQFFSLHELNTAILELLEILNRRPFKKIKGSRLSMYEDIEKSVLKPLPKDRYEISEWKKAKVNIDYHIELKGHYYSVPYQLVNEEVEIRYTAVVVEIYQKGRRITSHLREYSPGRHTTIKEHMPKSHQAYMEWTPSRIIEWAGKIGESVKKVVETIINSRAIHEHGYRPSLGIIRLGKRYGEARLESACKRAIAIKGYSYRSIKSILEKGLDKHPLPAEVKIKRIIHENIRGKEYYTGINNN